ncbi:AIG2-like family protein [compost metagenome]
MGVPQDTVAPAGLRRPDRPTCPASEGAGPRRFETNTIPEYVCQLLVKSMIERLFVYGTLAPGRPNEHVLGEVGGSWEAASVTGRLRQEGWGAEMGYPGLDLDEKGEEIAGFLFTSENLSAYWEKLDAFEGSAYERVLTSAKLEDNRVVDAYVYALRKA